MVDYLPAVQRAASYSLGAWLNRDEAEAILHDIQRWQRIEAAARAWTDAREADGHLAGHSAIPSAQKLLDELNRRDLI